MGWTLLARFQRLATWFRQLRRERFRPTAPNQVWGLDFVADQLADGRRFRALTVLDIFTREGVAIEVGQSLKGDDVVRTLNRSKSKSGVPKLLFCDNGSEFSSQAMDLWAYQNGVKIDFSRPGKPTDNAFVESFNGTFRAECLDAHWFTISMKQRRSSKTGGRNTTWFHTAPPRYVVENKLSSCWESGTAGRRVPCDTRRLSA